MVNRWIVNRWIVNRRRKLHQPNMNDENFLFTPGTSTPHQLHAHTKKYEYKNPSIGILKLVTNKKKRGQEGQPK